MASKLFLLVSVAAIALLSEPLVRRAKVLGITRLWGTIENIHGLDPTTIPNTQYTEDLHYHEPSGLIFGASEPNTERRWKWFPPMTMFGDVSAAHAQGTIVVIDSRTSEAQRLELLNFDGPFNTHGIDIWSPPSEPDTLYIHAVNHIPNPLYSNASDNTAPRSRSRIEIFRHTIGSSSVTHLRSVWHPLIRTPNDVLAVSATEFYLTNDHRYPEEGFARSAEDFDLPGFGKNTDVVHISVSSLAASDDTEGVTATVAIKGLHNNNGLGYGSSRDEILVGRCVSGVLEITKRSGTGPQLEVVRTVQVDSILDNPSYFHDPYAEETGRDASGYVLAGLSRAITWPHAEGGNPTIVWLVQRPSTTLPVNPESSSNAWTKKVIFHDDGKLATSASVALLVAIDPAKNGGKKQARLFVTGPISEGVVVTTIEI